MFLSLYVHGAGRVRLPCDRNASCALCRRVKNYSYASDYSRQCALLPECKRHGRGSYRNSRSSDRESETHSRIERWCPYISGYELANKICLILPIPGTAVLAAS